MNSTAQEPRVVKYIQFMLPHPNFSDLRDYVSIELSDSGLDPSQVPQGYLFYRTFSRKEMHAPDGEVLTGRISDESAWSCYVEAILKK